MINCKKCQGEYTMKRVPRSLLDKVLNKTERYECQKCKAVYKV